MFVSCRSDVINGNEIHIIEIENFLNASVKSNHKDNKETCLFTLE